MTTTNMEYEQEKMNFFKKHNFDYVAQTSHMSNNSYIKEYVFEDDAIWHETYDQIFEKVTITNHGIETNVKVCYRRTEYYNSDNASSKFVYENW